MHYFQNTRVAAEGNLAVNRTYHGILWITSAAAFNFGVDNAAVLVKLVNPGQAGKPSHSALYVLQACDHAFSITSAVRKYSCRRYQLFDSVLSIDHNTTQIHCDFIVTIAPLLYVSGQNATSATRFYSLAIVIYQIIIDLH